MNVFIGFFDLARDLLRKRLALVLFILAVSVAVIAVSVSVFSADDALAVHKRLSLNEFIEQATR